MIRDWEPKDSEAIERIHDASQFDYRFPDLSDPLFIVKKVVEENGQVVQSFSCKLVLCIYLIADREFGTPIERWNRLKELVEAAKHEAWKKGLDEAYCVVPPEIDSEFAPWLEKLGMTRDRNWPKWSIAIE